MANKTVYNVLTESQWEVVRTALMHYEWSLQEGDHYFSNSKAQGQLRALRNAWVKLEYPIGRNQAGAKHCPACTRPYKKLSNEQRTRSGEFPGKEKEAAKQLGDMGNACKKVYEFLMFKKSEPLLGDWVSATKLRELLNGGDGPRRVRQLRDEYGIPIEVKMDKEEGMNRQAYYRIVEHTTLLEMLGDSNG